MFIWHKLISGNDRNGSFCLGYIFRFTQQERPWKLLVGFNLKYMPDKTIVYSMLNQPKKTKNIN